MFSIGIGRPRKPALCQLYRRTFVPCGVVTNSEFFFVSGGVLCEILVLSCQWVCPLHVYMSIRLYIFLVIQASFFKRDLHGRPHIGTNGVSGPPVKWMKK